MTAMINDRLGTGQMLLPLRPAARGRAAEQRVIGDLLRRAQRGAGGVVLVDGEPGIGKSLLLRRAIDEAAELGFSLAAGAADELGQAIPFFAPRVTQIRAQLERRAAGPPRSWSALDDLHWASAATLAGRCGRLPGDLKRSPVGWLLGQVAHSPARRGSHVRPAGAGRCRPAHAGPARSRCGGGHDHRRVRRTAGPGPRPDLASGAAGNPAFVAELIGGLRDDHAVRVTGGRAVLTSARLPQRIHRLAQRRLDGLGQRARQLLGHGGGAGPRRSAWKMRPRCSARPRPGCCQWSRRPWPPRS